MKALLFSLRLDSAPVAGGHRKVTWLELFFDLIFVAAVSQVGEPLREHYTLAELARFTPLFVLIWWAWAGNAAFATRFDNDDVVQRLLTLVQMFAVAAMAANATDALDSRSSAGFAAAYAAVRLVLVAQYLRVSHLPHARRLARRYVGGHGAAAILWLASALVPAPERLWLWGVAFAIDLGTPWLAVRPSAEVPPNAAHLPERFGLFTLILLGEWVVAVMHGMESQHDWSVAAATSAFVGMGMAFVLWWWYFDGIAGASEQPVRTSRDAIRLHIWSYAHAPLYLAIFTAGVGVERMVTAAARTSVDHGDAALLAGATAGVMLSMMLIGAASARRDGRRVSPVVPHVALAGAALALGQVGLVDSPAAFVVAVASLCLAQLGLALGGPWAWRHAAQRAPGVTAA